MSKKYELNSETGLQTYANLKKVFHVGESYTEDELGGSKDDTLEDGTAIFVEVSAERTERPKSGGKMTFGKKEAAPAGDQSGSGDQASGEAKIGNVDPDKVTV